MSDFALNKSTLNTARQRRDLLDKYLPSLEMKQRQLLRERLLNRQERDELLAQIEEINAFVEKNLPMLVDSQINLSGLIKLDVIEIGHLNVVGVVLPKLDTLKVARQPYSFLARPHWVENLLAQWEKMLELKVRLSINEQSHQLLDEAVQKITQRVNLFSKVLIPDTEATIDKISVFLSDQERAAVVRAKIAKRRRAGV